MNRYCVLKYVNNYCLCNFGSNIYTMQLKKKMSSTEEKVKLEQKNVPSVLPQLLCAIALSFGSTISGGGCPFQVLPFLRL